MLLLSKSRSRLDPSLQLTKIFFFIPQQYLYILHSRLLGELGSRPERSEQGSEEFITYSFNMYNVQTPTNNYSFLFAVNIGKYVFFYHGFLCSLFPLSRLFRNEQGHISNSWLQCYKYLHRKLSNFRSYCFFLYILYLFTSFYLYSLFDFILPGIFQIVVLPFIEVSPSYFSNNFHGLFPATQWVHYLTEGKMRLC